MFRIVDPYAVSGTFHKAQLHTHTLNSIDGRWSVNELHEKYHELGFSFVFITDHDRVTALPEQAKLPLLLTGEENTAVWPMWPLGRHMLVLFAKSHPRRRGVQQRLDEVLGQDALVVMCHPSWKGNFGAGAWPFNTLATLKGYRLMEISNYHSETSKDVAIWDRLLESRSHTNPLWAVAVDDAHHDKRAGKGWIEVKVEKISVDDIRRALVDGRFYATTGVEAEFGATDNKVWATSKINLKKVEDDEVIPVCRFVRGLGDHTDVAMTQSELGAFKAELEVNGSERYIRAEILMGAKRAWSQPFWIISGEDAL